MLLNLIYRNSFRHKLRTILTIVGLAVAVMAFGLIRTVVDAWYAGVEASAPDRLITRSSISITFTLPLSYKEQIEKIEGIKAVTYANWFGGVYVDASNFFAQFAVEKGNYFKVFPEFIIPPDVMDAFNSNIKAVVVGQKLADRFGWKVGDRVTLIGTIYPGNWDFDVVGIYKGKDQTTDESTWFMRWDYIDETMKQQMPGRAGEIGWYGLQLADPNKAAEVSAAVDARFKNSSAETLTETEKAFQMSFVAMSGAILVLLTVMSWLIIGVILMVLVNTMAMTARERTSEYAFMKSMGFQGYHLWGMISGEAIVISLTGGLLGLVFLAGIVDVMKAGLSAWFPVFKVQPLTWILVVSLAIAIGLIASAFPVLKAMRMRIVDGLRVVD
ncbi:MAG: ABC transporter permease [bacterium]|nr:ABC transporter permease [bacterium]